MHTGGLLLLQPRADAHLRRQMMVARGQDSSMNGDGCPVPLLPPNSIMMASMGVGRGPPQMLFGSQNSPPQQQQSPGEFPALQAAFDLTSNGSNNNAPNNSPQSAAALKRKELFNQRKQREFIPDNKKDDSYWDRRRRNNEAAKRSREKRRFNDMILEQRVLELTRETHILKAQLMAIKDKFGINGDSLICLEQVLATLPSNEQVLSLTKRTTKVFSEFGKGGCSDQYSDDECTRDTIDHNEQHAYMQQQHAADDRSRSPALAHHHLGHLQQQHRGRMAPHIDTEKNNGERSIFKFGAEDCSPNANTRSSSRSSLSSQSDDILNLSIAHTSNNNNNSNGNAPGPMDQDERSSESAPSKSSRGGNKPKVSFAEPAGKDKAVALNPESIIKAHINVIVNGASNINGNSASSGASNLPHKLRHKMSHMGEKDLLPFPFSLKRESQLLVSPPCTDQWDNDESTNSGSGSSDERDSGISINGETSDKFGPNHRQPSPLSSYKVPSPIADKHDQVVLLPGMAETNNNSTTSGPPAPQSLSSALASTVPRKRAKKRILEESILETENSQLKTEMARLAAEVACLKSFLTTKKPTGEANDENSCDSSQ